MASSTVGPITPTDAQIHERASRVVYKGLEIIESMFSEPATWNYEKLGAVAAAVQAGNDAMLPPDDKDSEEYT